MITECFFLYVCATRQSVTGAYTYRWPQWPTSGLKVLKVPKALGVRVLRVLILHLHPERPALLESKLRGGGPPTKRGHHPWWANDPVYRVLKPAPNIGAQIPHAALVRGKISIRLGPRLRMRVFAQRIVAKTSMSAQTARARNRVLIGMLIHAHWVVALGPPATRAGVLWLVRPYPPLGVRKDAAVVVASHPKSAAIAWRTPRHFLRLWLGSLKRRKQ